MPVCYRNESGIVILSAIVQLHGDEETGAITRVNPEKTKMARFGEVSCTE